ncbi:MAG: hypothetical protein AVDCRST_MAG16-2857 [uncultured Frankineae bacterium]|uniref:Uncharacterized protein n=1 Tax=uncultured Frankineae bacterium TaxID=437475 RepID=A0A6J4MHW4_9ACTN|nr:MAG: hypothetical protein AVDCRST_MAG16-2857 [uncultured Frankineae bacterium]
MAGAGAALCLYATAWSAGSQTSTLVVLGLTALVCAGLAATRLPGALPAVAVGTAGVLAAAELAAAGLAAELATDQTGALLLLAVAVLAAVSPLLDACRRLGADVAAAATGGTALVLTAGDAGWLSWTLLGLGLIALATALRPDRRPAAVLAAVLMTGSSWVRLAEARIDVPEPYLLPVAVAALVLGLLRRRTDPGVTSWVYAPGLSLALLPTLLVSLGRDDLTRSLLVGLAALAVLLVGARARLQAPLAIGTAVLAVDAVRLLGPYAVAMPRWLSLAAAGALLLAVGADYEQRRRDVGRLRDRFDALA